MPVLLLILLLGAGAAPLPENAAPSLDPSKRLTQYVRKSWGMEEGLPQNSVQALHQDAAGYLWLGTEEGLVRFDGVEFRTFDRATTRAFERSHNVLALAGDADGGLWIGTSGAGAVRMRDGIFTPVDTSGALAHAQVSALLRTGAAMWVGTWDAGLYRCEADGCEPVDPGPAGGIYALASDQTGRVFAGTGSGVLVISEGRPGSLAELEGLHVQSLFGDRSGRLWIGTAGGLFRVEGSDVRRLAPADGWPGETVWSMHEDESGSMWFGLDQHGLLRVGARGADRMSADEGLAGRQVMALLGDREGSLWIGTAFGGLTRLGDGAFTSIGTAEGLSSPTATTIYEDRDGTVWVGTLGGGTNRIVDSPSGLVAVPFGAPAGIVTGITGTADGSIWIGTVDGGVRRTLRGTTTRLDASTGLVGDAAYVLYTDRRGAVWIGTENGVSVVDGRSIRRYRTEEGLSANSVTAIVEAADGAVWIGTYDAGLNRLTATGVEIFTTEDGLGSNTISALYEDPQRTLWVGTNGGGLSAWREGRFRTVSTREGLFSDQVFQILEDDLGNLWMGSNKGVARMRKRDILDVMDGRRASVVYEHFGRDDGMKSPEVLGGVQPAGWKDRKGRLWFPTVEGVTVVDPADLRRNLVPPPVRIQEVLVDSDPVSSTGRLSLEPDAERIEFRYAALSLVDGRAVRYRYRLEGDEAEWSDATSQRSATYTHLRPGDYTFRVVASNNDGIWNDTGAVLAFTVEPGLLETVWFWLLCGLVVAAGLAAGYRLRTRSLREQQRRLEKMVTARTRDVLEAKNFIEAQSDLLRRSLKEKDVLLREIHHRVKNNLQMISSLLQLSSKQVHDSRARSLFAECRDRIYSISMVHELLYRSRDMANVDFGEYLERIMEQLSRSHDLAESRIRTEVVAAPIRLETYQAIPCGLIVTELVSNAFKHAFRPGDVGFVRVGMEANGATCRLVVEDDGRGVPPDFSQRRENSLGLNLVDALVHRLHGAMTAVVESDEGMIGTRFEVEFPIGVHDHPDLFEGRSPDEGSSYVTRIGAEEAAVEPAVPGGSR